MESLQDIRDVDFGLHWLMQSPACSLLADQGAPAHLVARQKLLRSRRCVYLCGRPSTNCRHQHRTRQRTAPGPRQHHRAVSSARPTTSARTASASGSESGESWRSQGIAHPGIGIAHGACQARLRAIRPLRALSSASSVAAPATAPARTNHWRECLGSDTWVPLQLAAHDHRRQSAADLGS